MTLRSNGRCQERARKISCVELPGDSSPPRHSAIAAHQHPVLKCSNKADLAILDYACSIQRAFVVELLSLTTTTQKLQAAHVRYLIIVTMPATED